MKQDEDDMLAGLFRIQVRRAALAVTTVAAGAVLSGCGQETATPNEAEASKVVCNDAPRAKPGATVNSDVDGPYEDASLGEVAEASDVIVSGTVTEACGGNLLSADDSLEYTIFTVQPDTEDAAAVQVAYPTEIDGTPAVFEGQAVPGVGDEGVWFLTAVPEQFDFSGYVLTSTASGIIFDDSGRIVNKGSQPLLTEAKRLGTKAAVLRAAS